MQEVSRENLVPGKEYYLQNFRCEYFPPEYPYKMIATFERLTPCSGFEDYFNWACFYNFRKIEDRNNTNITRYVVLNRHWKFYEISQNKVQKNMENRAYNQVLLDLIQDDYFTPGNFI